MKVTVEKIDDINIILSGKIKNTIIEKRFSDSKKILADEITDEALQEKVESEILQEFIDAGLSEANINVENILGQPGFRKYEKQGDSIYYEIEISTNPYIDVNIEYSDIIPSYTKPDVTQSDIETKLKELALQQAPFTKIKEPKAIQIGDVALIDFEGFVDSKSFEGGSATNFKLKIGSDSFIPGFEEQLIGMNYGEERSIKITFPDDYISPDLASKETTFVVKLHEIQEQIAMTIDNDFAKKVLNDSNINLDTLKEKLKEQMASQALSALYKTTLKPKLVEGLLSKFNFTLPNNIIEQEIDANVRALLQTMDKEELEQQKSDKEKFQQLRDSVREKARDSIKTALIIEALAKQKCIIVDDNEVIEALKHQANLIGQDSEKLVKHYEDNNLLTSVKIGLTEDKLIGALLEL